MALSSSRGGLSISRHVLRHWKSSYSLTQPAAVIVAPFASRQFSASSARREQTESLKDVEEELPRWAHTPDRMVAPFSLALPKHPERSVWEVNSDPAKLDHFYDTMLGREGHKMLPEELKWLAVTHKSFDYGRRGFNTRLAQLGRHVMALEATRLVMSVEPASIKRPRPDMDESRQPFQHPDLEAIDNLSYAHPADIVSPEKLAKLATELGLPQVVRWKPKDPAKLKGSGLNSVLTSTMFAIVGAVSLQHGAAAANRICKERIMKKLAI